AQCGGLPPGALALSALTAEGIPELVAALAVRVAETYDITAPLLTRARHREALEMSAEALQRSLDANLAELRAEDLRLAWRSLGRITGRVDVEDLLDVIFADFCLGKSTELCACLTYPVSVTRPARPSYESKKCSRNDRPIRIL